MSLISQKTDFSFWSLVLTNLLTMAMAVRFNWSLLELMWIYLLQSITIGVFNYIKMVQVAASADNPGMFPTIFGGRGQDANFFAMHYGFFHLLYILFLLAFTLAPDSPLAGPTPIYWPSVFGTALMFIANHAFSYFYNRPKDAPKWTSERLMFFPYARIFPMHLTLILGGLANVFFPFSPLAGAYFPIILFMVLKTGADAIMHLIEHR